MIRLRVKPDTTTTGSVDGAWWPRSRDLATEVPVLAGALAGSWDPVESVSYHLADWNTGPRKIDSAAWPIRLDGFRMQHPGTIDVISRLRRLTLVVISPETAADAAERTLARAAQPGNIDGVDELLDPHPHRVPAPEPESTANGEPTVQHRRNGT
ncbi:DUF5994 family protein [Pseudonocardia sp. GCM10023141]|uniref:DUF5994 family protein n=1 Tax=Pseudonocardia sp. GCM10023141 TaxID=3252653 RepID=UPI003609DCC8